MKCPVFVYNLDNKNQFVIVTSKGSYFQSYDSVVAFVGFDGKSVKVFGNWNYSKTTKKHLKIFLTEKAYCIPAKVKYYLLYGKGTFEKRIKKLAELGFIKLSK